MNSQLSRIINKISASVPHASDLLPAMQGQRDRIRMRALAGVDVNGFPFRPKKDGSASHLTRTGNLLRSLQATVSEDGSRVLGRVSVTGRAREYAPHVNAKRRFLGASTGDRRDVLNQLQAAMAERRKNV